MIKVFTPFRSLSLNKFNVAFMKVINRKRFFNVKVKTNLYKVTIKYRILVNVSIHPQ